VVAEAARSETPIKGPRMSQRTTIAQALESLPNVGEDADFAR
jgi:hypothetical protein